MIQTEVNKSTWRDWARDHPEHKLDLERELVSKKLVLPFGLDGIRMVCHQLLYLKTKGHVQKMRAFREWLFEELSQSMRGISGES